MFCVLFFCGKFQWLGIFSYCRRLLTCFWTMKIKFQWVPLYVLKQMSVWDHYHHKEERCLHWHVGSLPSTSTTWEALGMGIWLWVRWQLKVIWQYCSPEAERGWESNSFNLKEGSEQCSTKFTKVYFFASWYLYKFWEWLIDDDGCLLILVET